MVARKNIKKYALISVYNKKKLKFLCKSLNSNGYSLISTGSTAKEIRKIGFKCLNVSSITKYKEILDGRVKTFDQKLYGSILYKRDNYKHVNEFKKIDVPKIDIVIIDLYPFVKFLNSSDQEKIIEMIDIGGHSLIRASSKNYKFVTIISDIKDYKKLSDNLNKNSGSTDIKFRKKNGYKVIYVNSKL